MAVHSDTWLLAVAFYNGARLNREGRERLFELINEQPTCYEIVSGKASRDAAKPKKRGAPGQPARPPSMAPPAKIPRMVRPAAHITLFRVPDSAPSRWSCLFFEIDAVLGVCDHVAGSSGRLSSLPKAYLPG